MRVFSLQPSTRLFFFYWIKSTPLQQIVFCPEVKDTKWRAEFDRTNAAVLALMCTFVPLWFFKLDDLFMCVPSAALLHCSGLLQSALQKSTPDAYTVFDFTQRGTVGRGVFMRWQESANIRTKSSPLNF